ncbi:sugar transferase [Truepera radiovictrix]|jgi:sugar transferase EpsL|uniref:Sugar transferase n=1 Tax=Truepera radiovictrix (strain DSM 17093 / CIP 108686 / LMG 22925 / RQ-24) TaxID=649638 RepID=D7CXC0_TRURR|nr:sugar transferase [Truepera radiovictrix]ADI13244.1 sugar transferase [Truepera radiovictrix DSM 17093]WMT58192.1 sugar transferase [Truepera radiovictrix]
MSEAAKGAAGLAQRVLEMSGARYERLKRALDVTFAALGLLVLGPLMAVIALVIRWRMGAPVLFRQVRPGRFERPFTLLKFRTMHDTRGADGELLPPPQRITPLGVWLRKTSLDELPQLFNVLRGDMSFVGPRPLLASYLPYYRERERLRHRVRPGITGLAQVSGRNRLPWDERLELDARYAETLSLALDARIVLATLVKVLRRSDVLDIPLDHGGFIKERAARGEGG